MADLDDPAGVLRHYLSEAREALWWKLDGLDERAARLPRTPTGTNLLGIVKHCLNVEAGYFGPTFGRAFEAEAELVPPSAFDDDPQADWYARPDESMAGLLDLHRRVAAFADAALQELPLDAPGRVAWWRPGRQDVTLHRVAVHVLTDLTRHAGHADVLREQVDGAVGLRRDGTNVPDDQDWPAYVARLRQVADGFHRPH